MPEQTFGRVTVRGTDAQILIAKTAFDECDVLYDVLGLRLENEVGRDYAIEFHTEAEFRQKGYVFDDGSVNWGRVLGATDTLWVRDDVRVRYIKHLIRHECCHVVPHSGKNKQADLMAFMWNRNGNHPTKWNPPKYAARPEECFADTLAEAISGLDSPWDDFNLYSLDVHEEDHRAFMKRVFV